jgi:hypothetical protein
MNKSKLVLFTLIGLVILIAGISVTVMISSTSFMNGAAEYATAHLDQLAVPEPLPAALVYPEPPVRVEAVARMGDLVEVQITRRYQTARSPDAEFTATYFYQTIGDTWQLVAPPGNYWGDPKTTRGTRVVIQHTQRNQKLIDNLVKVVDPALESACDQWRCPTDLKPITLTFSTDPSLTADLATYPMPQLTGVPFTLSANADYLTNIAANAVRLLAQELHLAPELAEAEIKRQDLYAP